ncbi:hypothetical protein [Actinoplanes solisilvae]|uniref:hypothetical protein n=1 Tax=Actinoplanes solisilvae TaxID=2486853 RepID=UPI000FDB6874|nr:hypothetical protein [Actinoplanes solisilvae]
MVGINVPHTAPRDPAAGVTAFAREAELLGFDSLWAYDRLLSPQDQSGAHRAFGIAGVPWPEPRGLDELIDGAARLRAAWKETGQDH